MFLKHLISGSFFLVTIACAASDRSGFLEGHLKIVSLKEVELADENSPAVTPKAYDQNYSEYPLIILSRDGKKEIAQVTADKDGSYRIPLPPGDYVLDLKGRGHGLVRAKPQPFTVTPNQTVHVDMDIDTGIR
jgi:hypothetical protein